MLERTVSKKTFEVLDRFGEPNAQLRRGLPVEMLSCHREVWTALPRIVLRHRPIDYPRLPTGQIDDHFCQLSDSELLLVADIDGAGDAVVGVHQLD